MGKRKIFEKDKVTKFIDWLIEDIENVEYFNIKDFINKYKDISEHEKGYLPHSIESVGKTYSLFENTLNSDDWFKLTEKGIRLKESGKSLNEYQKSLLPKWYNANWVGYVIAFITLLFAVYQGFQNHFLEKDISSLKLSFDSLKPSTDSLRNEVLYDKKKLDSLNVQFDFLEEKFSDLKNKIEKKK
jgi:hypothetical protein